MTERRASAHPMLEPLDYELTPDKAKAIFQGELLDVYELLWNAAVATAVDAPALRQQTIDILVRKVEGGSSQKRGMLLQAFKVDCIEPGWNSLLPCEGMDIGWLGKFIGEVFPRIVADALAVSGRYRLDGDGRRYRPADQCAPLVPLLAPLDTWQSSIVTIDDAAYSLDQLIEQMAANGIGRPSTFADRLTAAIENDLVRNGGDSMELGGYGLQLLTALAALPDAAVVNAQYSADLERALQAVEADHSTAGDTLRQFCERALGITTPLARWLDELVIEGESLNEAIARADKILPSANSWDSLALPAGISPEHLAKNPDEAISLRTELDGILSAPDRNGWKRHSPRWRAACRLAALATGKGMSQQEGWALRASRDIVLRWWVDLAPQEMPFLPEELGEASRSLLALDADSKAGIAALADKIAQLL